MTARRIEIFVIIVVIAVVGVVYALTRAPSITPSITETPIDVLVEEHGGGVQQVPEATISYRGVEGKNALELLRSSHVIETQDFGDLGEFVKSIDGVEPTSTHFWGFYVDGKLAQVGAGAYDTSNSELIEWRLITIE